MTGTESWTSDPLFLVMIAAVIFSLIARWQIFAKAGYSGVLSLLMFVPLLNLLVFLFLAFSEWPVQRELRMYQMQSTHPPSQPYK